jgi:DNA-binding transcriptional ArsR family regulator
MDDVFKALADDGRRALLDSLRERDGQSLTELCDVLPNMTRFGVMKHLRVLEDAHLVLVERSGRAKHHHLNPMPIREIHDRWIAPYREPLVVGLLALRDRAEGA